MRPRLLAAVVAAGALLAFPAAAQAASTSLVINEIDYDQPGADTAEFLEIKNVSGAAIDLDPYIVELVNGNGGARLPDGQLPAASLAAGDHYLICATVATTAGCDLRTRQLDPERRSRRGRTAPWHDAGRRRQLRRQHRRSLHRGHGRRPRHRRRRRRHLALPGRRRQRPQQRRLRAQPDHARRRERLRSAAPAAAAVRRLRRRPGDPDPHDPGHPGREPGRRAACAPSRASSSATSRAPTGLNGFFVQEETGHADTNPQTSEGLFVFAPSSAAVDPGDIVRVQGTVSEFNGKTQLGTLTNLVVCPGEASVTPAAVTLPVSALTDHEPREGMLVTLPQALSIGEYFNFDRFNETVLSVGRQMTPTAVVEPGAPGAGARPGEHARPDHPRRRPQRPEPRDAAPPGRRALHPRQPLPRR